MGRPLVALFLVAGTSGCTPSGVGKVPGSTGPTTPTPEPVPTTPPVPTIDTDTPPPTPTGDTGPAYDPCTAVPAAPLATRFLPGTSVSEEFAFDTSGYVYNAHEAGVVRAPLGGASAVIAPYEAVEIAGTRFLSDGVTLAVCDEYDGTVMGVDVTTGGTTILASGLDSPNSVGFDTRGFMYVATYGSIVQVDLTTGATDTLLYAYGRDFDGITFSPDWSRVYYNHDDGGTIGYTQLDSGGSAVATGLFAQIALTDGDQLDGMATDACGNVYAIHVYGKLTRIRPDGTIEDYADLGNGAYTTAVNFGSGVGGWERDRLYVMDRNIGLYELEVGVEGRPEVHLP